jgi:multiple sugar transport system substrate-binding protein
MLTRCLTLARRFWSGSLLALLLAGCSTDTSVPDSAPTEAPLKGVNMRLLVVDDPALAAAVGRLRGEWNIQTGANYEVAETTAADFAAASSLAADALLLPSSELGIAAERGLIAPLSKKTLESSVGNWTEIFELQRLHEVAWGPEVYGVPLGSPVLVCYYRADLLAKLGRKPPQTWDEYQELARLLNKKSDADNSRNGECFGTFEPLAPGWAGLVLLARAAPYTRHRDNYSTFFQIDTMEPLVDGPPFVRALEELVAAARFAPSDQLRSDPAAVRQAFWQGRCAMALTWPTASLPQPTADPNVQAGVVELPGCSSVYNVSKRAWETEPERRIRHVPMLSMTGRVGAVAKSSTNPAAAVQLLSWLSGNTSDGPVSRGSSSATLFRRSHLASPQLWVEKCMAAHVAAEYVALAERTFSLPLWARAPQIPGRAEYLQALDVAVQQAVRGERSAADALRETAARWRTITERLGRSAQQSALSRSAELEP